MAAAANFAFANRAIMTMHTRDVFSEIFGQTAEQLDMNVVYDVSHNVAKVFTLCQRAIQ
jgi:tRNA-splicing ligase RtcB